MHMMVTVRSPPISHDLIDRSLVVAVMINIPTIIRAARLLLLRNKITEYC